MWNFNIIFPAATKLFEAGQLDPTGKDNTLCPFSVAFKEAGEPLGTIWDYHRTHPDDEQAFHNSMNATLSSSTWSPQHILRVFDWNRVNTVVDVGGSAGHVSMAIFDGFPHIQFTVEDVGEVIETSRRDLPQKYAKNITFLEHDFFKPQPVAADCYILRFILHNWSDYDAQRIISSLASAFRPGTKLIAFDHVLPEPGSISAHMETVVRNMDITMYGLMAGKERSQEDFVKIVKKGDPRMELKSCVTPPGSAASALIFECM